MKVRAATAFKLGGAALALVMAAGIVVPYIDTGSYGERLRGSLERALGRRVEFRGPVRFSLFSGPGFSVDDVVIHEDPSIGQEPIAYMDNMTVRPGLWSLAGGRFVIASISLDGASINLAKSGPASEWGRWNFASLVNRSVMSRAPSLHVRNSRIHFKFGDEKSVFYLTETDLDISPPRAAGGGWSLDCSAQPARTDRTAQGLGEFRLRGRWYVAPERVDLNLEIERTLLGEMTALLRGQAGGVNGRISARLHLAGPIDQIGIAGRLTIEDVHRWDLMPPYGQGWPLDVRGRLNLPGQDLEIESGSVNGAALPLAVRLHASNYLSQPRWAASLQLESFSAGSAAGTGAAYGPGGSAQAGTGRRGGWRHRLLRRGQPAGRTGAARRGGHHPGCAAAHARSGQYRTRWRPRAAGADAGAHRGPGPGANRSRLRLRRGRVRYRDLRRAHEEWRLCAHRLRWRPCPGWNRFGAAIGAASYATIATPAKRDGPAACKSTRPRCRLMASPIRC